MTDNDECITRYFDGEACPECGDDEGLVEVRDGDETYLECKKCGAISNNGEHGGGHTFI
jgi:translation initiation factor 2 beta subunit (eIF-2beta)/eIF-5